MLTFQQLKKNIKHIEKKDFKKVTMALLGDTATQMLAQAIKGYGVEEKINISLYEADYNQIEEQIYDRNSELYKKKPEYVVLYISSEMLYESYCSMNVIKRIEFADTWIEKIKNYWDNISEGLNCKILQFNFVEIYDGIFGNFGSKIFASFLYQIRKLNFFLMELGAEYKAISIVDLSSIQNYYGRKQTYDNKYFYSARMALSLEVLPQIAKNILDIIYALNGKFKKCVVLDLDNTVWGGVIGDDGLANIQIGELGQGRAFSDFQRFLKLLKDRGIILAVCSKNNEKIAMEPFLKHPEMILKLEDISLFVANWEDKASNIKYIQKVLNIGMDSIVFIDDNPFERNLVKSLIPDIIVPDLPEDPALYVEYIKSMNLFETVSYSEEDHIRTVQYQAEIKRNNLQETYDSIDEYLISLDMIAEVGEFNAFYCPRIAQLSQRSNQFNLRTIRYSENDIQRIIKDNNYITLYYTLTDKFGDYGLISAVILKIQEDNTAFIESWFMSCRVLKRGMEEFIINKVVEKAKESNIKKIMGEYIETQKNSMVKSIYETLGFKKLSDTLYEADTDTFCKNKTYVKEK